MHFDSSKGVGAILDNFDYLCLQVSFQIVSVFLQRHFFNLSTCDYFSLFTFSFPLWRWSCQVGSSFTHSAQEISSLDDSVAPEIVLKGDLFSDDVQCYHSINVRIVKN